MTDEGEPAIAATVGRRFAAFETRNFRFYFAGQVLSSVGTWSQTLAVTALVFDLTGKSAQLGLTIALQFLPMLLLGTVAGLVADRYDNRRILMATSLGQGGLAVLYGVLAHTGHVSILTIDLITVAFGSVGAFERTTMQAFVPQLVPGEHMQSAIAMANTVNGTARMAGPALAGFLVTHAGIAACFFVNASSFGVLWVTLVLMRTRDIRVRAMLERAQGGIREGFRYVRARPPVRRPIAVMLVIGTVAFNFLVTVPAIVEFTFHRDAGAIGLVFGVSSVGTLIGAYFAAGVAPSNLRVAGSLLVMCGALAALGVAPSFLWFVIAIVPMSTSSAYFQAMLVAMLLRETEPVMRGRVMSLYQIAWQGTTPIGTPLMGVIAQIATPRVPFVLAAVAAGLSATVLLRTSPGRGAVATNP
jgi:MFS family permease